MSIFKKEKSFTALAPLSGVIKPIEQVPDEAFSEKLLGIGVAVIPENGEVFSPVNGEVIEITDTKHAICITTDEGAEFLLHIGIDTVNLKGNGFSVFVNKGDRVLAGDKIAEVDIEFLKSNDFLTDTPILLTNPERFKITEFYEGSVRGGESPVFNYTK